MIRYTRFIALGDSFTEGVGDIQVDGQFRGWADRVAERIALQQSNFSYCNLAIRGKLVAEVVDNQIPEATNWIQGPSTLVSFHAGANDVLRPGYNPEIVLRQYREAVRKLAATGAQLLLFTAIERVAKSGKMQEMWQQRFSGFNNNVRAIALEVGAILADANLDPDIATARFVDTDKLHLNPAGHARVAESVLQLIGAKFDPNWSAPLPLLPQIGKIKAIWAELNWIITFLIPWISRRIRGISSGDGRVAKHREPITLS